MSTHTHLHIKETRKDIPIMIPIMPPDLALLSTLIGLNYPCLQLIFMIPKVFEPLKFYCISYFYLHFNSFYLKLLISHTKFSSSAQLFQDISSLGKHFDFDILGVDYYYNVN